MDQQAQIDQPSRVQPVAQAQAPAKPLARYDGTMFLAHRPVDIYGGEHRVLQPTTVFSNQGLVTTTDPIRLQPNPLFIPTLPTQ